MPTLHTDRTLTELADAFEHDPKSWEQWGCLHITLVDEEMETAESDKLISRITAALHESLGNVEHRIFMSTKNELFVFCQQWESCALDEIDSAFHNSLTPQECREFSCATYRMSRDWRTMVNLCRETEASRLLLFSGSSEATQVEDCEFAQDEIEQFREVFEGMLETRMFRKPAHVMLVEDDEIARRLVAKLLKNDYRLITAKDADEAVADYLLYAPDIVFLDINLPGHSGFSVLRALRKCDPNAYIVMFSGNGYMENLLHAMHNGAQGFIAKPFRKEQLMHYIQDCAMKQDNSHLAAHY